MEQKQIEIPKGFNPRPYQLKALQAFYGTKGQKDGLKRLFLRWHRRSGKDFFCWALMIREAFSRPGLYYYFLPTYAQGKKVIWEGISNEGLKFINMIPAEFITRRSNQEMLIELSTGSIIRIVGTDNYDTIRGTNPVGCVFSEYAYQDPAAWEVVAPILRMNKGWAVFNSTPNGRNHMYEMEMAVKQLDNWYVSELQTLWPKRPNYTGLVVPEEIQQEIDEGKDQEFIEQEYGVSFAAGLKGAYYIDCIATAEHEGRIGNYPPNTRGWVDTFWDLGVDDSTAIWFRQLDGRRVVWIDYYEESGKDLAHYAEVLKQRGYKYRTHYLPHDASHRTIQTQYRTDEMFMLECKNAGISDDVVIVPKLPVQDGINGVRRRFPFYFFNKQLTADGLKKLELYHRKWDPKGKVFRKEPAHDWTSHAADALRSEVAAEEYENEANKPFQETQVITNFDILGD